MHIAAPHRGLQVHVRLAVQQELRDLEAIVEGCHGQRGVSVLRRNKYAQVSVGAKGIGESEGVWGG